MDFKNKHVLIMGLGVQGGGVGVARFFVAKGAKVTVTDLKTKTELAPSLKSLAGLPITYILGQHREQDFKTADLVIRNPDVPRESVFLKIAREHGVPIEMDESLFLKLCPKRNNVIGVTGTRGKTTTTHLIGAILQKAGFHTLLGGNLPGVATLSLLDKIKPETKVVLELSSWQLQGLGWSKLSPHVAVVTNIYPDHLNRYKSMRDYIEDKKIIFKYQKEEDFLVLNRDNQITKEFAKEAQSKICWFSRGVKLFHPRGVKLKLKGVHNQENLAAAYAVAKLFKISDNFIKEAISNFEGVPFRLQEIAEIGGVTYVNDTTSTMPEATIAALRAYNDVPIILICGGASKKLDFTNLGKEIAKRAKAVVLLEGTATDELNSKFQIPNSKFQILGRFSDLKKAVMTAKEAAHSGDVILLSPGCASFGLFKNEFDRGTQFNEIISSF